jgi:hypothetical protein
VALKVSLLILRGGCLLPFPSIFRATSQTLEPDICLQIAKTAKKATSSGIQHSAVLDKAKVRGRGATKNSPRLAQEPLRSMNAINSGFYQRQFGGFKNLSRRATRWLERQVPISPRLQPDFRKWSLIGRDFVPLRETL